MLAGRGGNLDQVSVAVDQEACPAEVCCEAQGAVQLLGEQGLCLGRRLGVERAVLRCED